MLLLIAEKLTGDWFQVILESLRMASIISFTFREAVADVEYKGKRVLFIKK